MTRLQMGLLIGCLAVFSPRGAQAWDVLSHGRPWRGGMPIKVKMNTNMTSLCSLGTCSNLSQFEHSILKVLNQMYMETGASVRLEYDGQTSVAPGSTIMDKVHVYAGDCDDIYWGQAAWSPMSSDNYYGRVRICIRNAAYPGGLAWHADASGAVVGPNAGVFAAVLAHELFHILGADDAGNDPTWDGTPTISNGNYSHYRTHLFPVDYEFLESTYGYRADHDLHAHARTTSDNASWVEGASPPAWSVYSRGRYVASSTPYQDASFVTWVWGGLPLVSRYDQYGWAMINLAWMTSDYYVGMSASSSSDVRLQYLSSGNVYERISTNGGDTWSAAVQLDPATTLTEGVASAYDYRTGQHIRVWRSTENWILYKIGDNPTQALMYGPNHYCAAHSPSIACGDPSNTGVNNCIMTWTDPTSWDATILWFQGQVMPGGWLWGTGLRSAPYFGSTSPAVGYIWGPSRPWVMAFNQGGSHNWTIKKAPGPDDWWETGAVAHSDSPKAMTPTIGSYRYVYFPFAWNRSILFTGHQ